MMTVINFCTLNINIFHFTAATKFKIELKLNNNTKHHYETRAVNLLTERY